MSGFLAFFDDRRTDRRSDRPRDTFSRRYLRTDSHYLYYTSSFIVIFTYASISSISCNSMKALQTRTDQKTYTLIQKSEDASHKDEGHIHYTLYIIQCISYCIRCIIYSVYSVHSYNCSPKRIIGGPRCR